MATFDIELRDSDAAFNINMGVNAWVIVDGEWKKITKAYVLVDGTWNTSKKVSIVVDGAWKDV